MIVVNLNPQFPQATSLISVSQVNPQFSFNRTASLGTDKIIMGQGVSSVLDCLSPVLDYSPAAQERLALLKKGENFHKGALLGLASEEIFVSLSEDTSTIEWKVVTKDNWMTAVGAVDKNKHGQIDLTSAVKNLKIQGENSLQFIGMDGKLIIEIKAKDAAVRDQWMVAINELLQSWVDKPDNKPKSAVSAAGTSDKAKYFKQREEEIEARQKASAERKAKYSTGGMKYTAQIIANRA